MKLTTQPIHPRKLTGFTLIELLVVIIIIAALAALVVPNVGQYGRSTDMAVSAKTQSDIAQQVQLFFVTQKQYPSGFDSLITTGATPDIYKADPENATTQTRGLPYSGSDGVNLGNGTTSTAGTVVTVSSPAQLTLFAVPTNSTGTVEYLRSITRAGLDVVFDHDTAVINSNLANTTQRTIAAGGNVAELTSDKALFAKLHPQTLRSGERIIAFGYGQRNSAIGKTSTTCPLYPGADKTYYGRYIVYFKIYASGERATLVGVSDAYGRTPDYTGQQFNESLPDGARQG
jgi:prepilin-type N-terminal cleavage/methylation domain-containing protein